MYELSNGDTTKSDFQNMIKYQDAVSDIYTEFKIKLSSATKSLSQSIEDQGTTALSKSTRIPSHVFGIHNIGNTCFFNSTMQACNATRELVDFYASSQDMFEDEDQLLGSTNLLPRHFKP